MKKSLLVLVLFMLIIPSVTTTVQAWGPHTHTWLTNELFPDAPENPPGKLADYAGYKDDFLAGSMIPDISVAYYFAEGGSKYRATHNWNFQWRLEEYARTHFGEPHIAFAYGVASHLISDSVSHTLCIPKRIKGYNIPNWLIHPLTEKKYDSLLALDNPGLKEESRKMLDAVLDGPHKDEYMEMLDYALLDVDFDVEENLIRLGYALDAFYGKEFRPEGGGIFALYPAIDGLTDWIYPLSTGSMSSVEFYVEKAYDQNVFYFDEDNWGNKNELSPHGWTELTEADAGASGIFHIMFFGYIFMMLALPVFLMWWRRDPRFLVFLPIMFFIFIGVIAGIYIII